LAFSRASCCIFNSSFSARLVYSSLWLPVSVVDDCPEQAIILTREHGMAFTARDEAVVWID
jgi:hypothetical protein